MGLLTAMDILTSMTAVRTDGNVAEGNNGETKGIGGGITPLVYDLKTVEPKQLGPESQLIIFRHESHSYEAALATFSQSAILSSPAHPGLISKFGGEPLFLRPRA
jgi:hypothetical protein